MKSYTIEIQLISDAIIGSGEGFGSLIDTDIVFDGLGVPFIPARRIKGCLRDAARRCRDDGQRRDYFIYRFEKEARSEGTQVFSLVEETFGRHGHVASAPVFFQISPSKNTNQTRAGFNTSAIHTRTSRRRTVSYLFTVIPASKPGLTNGAWPMSIRCGLSAR